MDALSSGYGALALVTLRKAMGKVHAAGGAVKARGAGFAIAVLAAALTGCAAGSNGVDAAFQTNAISMADASPSIAPDPFAPERSSDGGETDRLIDEDTIRLAVTTADLGKLTDQALPWASVATGSSGSISNIRQNQIAGQTCRSFAATRNAYDGVSLYRGEVCLDPRSGWWTRSLEPFSAG